MSIEERSAYVLNAEVERVVRLSGSSTIYLTRKIIAESDSPSMKKLKVVRDKIKVTDYSWFSRNLSMEDAVTLSDALIELSSMSQDKIIQEELKKNGY